MQMKWVALLPDHTCRWPGCKDRSSNRSPQEYSAYSCLLNSRLGGEQNYKEIPWRLTVR
jgi:hypothetical protein